eukprot:CAMPEP_0184302110 /NCGR_PEP_ID=MMETSP1049-20130417/12169_1 /TAXON_ID=77928 /ORGANISM="Proteomonas sulcata, Strain CCMP704" /LENGTH=89 /DNA_ID=CAMNT_0026613311 /DNA_START=151 /DNA_END=420 /DNA_ORIENTATION=-
MSEEYLKLKIELGGGLELLFQNQKKFEVSLPKRPNAPTIKELIAFLKEKHIKDRPEMFVQGETVRPGVLVLVNDTDWELCGGLEGEIEV